MVAKKNISRQKRKKNNTHKAIMHSAKTLFEKKGMGNVTIEEITEAADVSRSTFFSHFQSLEALSTEIAGVAIEDIITEHSKSKEKGIEGIHILFDKLVDDTCPYPHLTAELLMNGIVKSRGKSPFYYFINLINNELMVEEETYSDYSYNETTALLLGAYFGLLFQKLIKSEPLDSPDELKKTLKKLINNIVGGKK